MAELQQEAMKINILGSFEVQLAMEERINADRNRLLARQGATPHSWLQQYTYIGNERCILNTQNLVQKLMDILQVNQKLVGRPGF